ncbi:MAG: hypothetical protein FWG13_02480 [Leptospirales bacterium]|nr:hypothetical protein [Leptospirales bacterium]
MKKYLLTALIFSLAMFACKQEEPKQPVDSSPAIVGKCAKYAVNVYKDKERTAWRATLSKAEKVDLLSVEIITNNKGAVAEVALVKLSDGSEGYLETKHLADRAVVFTTDTSAYQRNNTGSRVTLTIPAGTLGFVIEEKAEWLQVYLGQIDNVWRNQEWVNSGFSTEADLITEAKLYEEALAVLKNKDAKESDRGAAIKKLDGLKTSALFSEKAENALTSLTGQKEDSSPAEQKEDADSEKP